MGPSALDVPGVCELQFLHKGRGVHCDGLRTMPCTVQAAFQHQLHFQMR